MKKINKLKINPERLIKDSELKTLQGGYGSYQCYEKGTDNACNGSFLGYINTAGCAMAKDICNTLWGGNCVNGGDC
jgi:natural product precursor